MTQTLLNAILQKPQKQNAILLFYPLIQNLLSLKSNQQNIEKETVSSENPWQTSSIQLAFVL